MGKKENAYPILAGEREGKESLGRTLRRRNGK
jgi:hypothetical protein